MNIFNRIVLSSLTFILFSSVKISPGAIVCDESEIVGDVTIGRDLHFYFICFLLILCWITKLSYLQLYTAKSQY